MKYIEFLQQVSDLGINSPVGVGKNNLILRVNNNMVTISERGPRAKTIVSVNLEQTGIVNFVLSKFGFDYNSLNYWKKSKALLQAHFTYNKNSIVKGRTNEQLMKLSKSMDNIITIVDEQIGNIQGAI